MRLFLSWSGNLSHDIAECLFQWLPLVMQRVEPYMSSQSIDKGARWSMHIGKELETSRFGIVVLTRDNLLAPWLHFEAGAIAKSLDETRLAPLLFGLRTSDVIQPLAQFQVTQFDEADMKKLLRSINVANGDALMPENNLLHLFDKMWSELKEKVDGVFDNHRTIAKPAPRSSEEVLEEVLILAREHATLLAQPERILGRSVDSLIGDVLEAYFAAESKLDESERVKVQALLARWSALTDRLLTHFNEDGSLGAGGLRQQILAFRRYVEEAREVIANAAARKRFKS
jgi:hypothetical protein